MKKFILMLATVVGLIGVFATSVLAHDYFGNVAIDENGKQVDMNSDNEPVNSAVIDREQSIAYEELLKAQVQNSSNGNAADDAQNSMTDEEKAILNAKAEKAEEEGTYLKNLFSEGLRIVNKYSSAEYDEKVDNISRIDRSILEAMVYVIEAGKADADEVYTLKLCLAEKCIIVPSSDALYNKIADLLN